MSDALSPFFPLWDSRAIALGKLIELRVSNKKRNAIGEKLLLGCSLFWNHNDKYIDFT